MKKSGVVASVAVFILVAIILIAVRCVKSTGGEDKTPPVVYTTTESSEKQDVTSVEQVNQYNKGLYLVSNESIINYDVPKIVADGTVSNRVLWLDGTQILYEIVITLDDLSSSNICYYCSKQVYDSVVVNDRVSVTYQKVTESAFSVYSVTRE